jgi:hypothetical protein
MCHGVRGDFTDYRRKTTLQGRSNWQVSVFQTGALPHFEIPALFCSTYEAFLDSIGSAKR